MWCRKRRYRTLCPKMQIPGAQKKRRINRKVGCLQVTLPWHTWVNPTKTSKSAQPRIAIILSSYWRRKYLLYITEALFGYVITVNKSSRTNFQANRPFEVWPGAHSTGNTGDRWIWKNFNVCRLISVMVRKNTI